MVGYFQYDCVFICYQDFVWDIEYGIYQFGDFVVMIDFGGVIVFQFMVIDLDLVGGFV